MFDIERISEWRGQDVLDPEDHRIGRLEEIYYDKQSSTPGFACVKTGLFGRRLSIVPLNDASMGRDHIRVAYLADQIKRAPSIEPDGQLTAVEEAALFEHYGLEPPIDSGVQSPRLVRYQTEEAALEVAQARQLMADQGELVGDPATYAAPAGSAATPQERARYGALRPAEEGAYPGEFAGDPALAAAAAGAALTPEERARYQSGGGFPAGAGAIDLDRLRALEERVTSIERWLADHGR